MNKNIRLLVEGFFDDEIFNTNNDIKTDIEDLGKYYDYKVGEIFYQNKKPYAVCCGEPKYFKDNKHRFCLLNVSDKQLKWRVNNGENNLVKELGRCEINYFYLTSFNDFKYINEDGYQNTQIIKNNYDITEFPVFEYCINKGNNVYLPAIDELQMMYLNKDKLGKYSLMSDYYWSSTQQSANNAYYISTEFGNVGSLDKFFSFRIYPFFHLD